MHYAILIYVDEKLYAEMSKEESDAHQAANSASVETNRQESGHIRFRRLSRRFTTRRRPPQRRTGTKLPPCTPRWLVSPPRR
jgi:hypothetical protein